MVSSRCHLFLTQAPVLPVPGLISSVGVAPLDTQTSSWNQIGESRSLRSTGSKRVSPTSIGLREAGADISLAASATALCRVGKNVALAGDLTELESQLKGEP